MDRRADAEFFVLRQNADADFHRVKVLSWTGMAGASETTAAA